MPSWGAVARRRPRGPLWRNADFLRLWAGQSVSQLGSQVTNLALPFVAILVLHATTFQVAALGVVEFLPFILFSLPAGVWVDRLPRRPILIVADCGRAVVLGTVPLAYALDFLTLGQLYAVGFAAGTFTVFFDVAYQSFLPSLVDRDELTDGNSKLEVTRAGAQVAGPGLAGVLVATFKAPYAILVDALSFVVSAACVLQIRAREAKPATVAATRSMRAEIAEGLGYVVRHPLMRPMLVYVAANNFFTSLIGSILLVFAVRTLHIDPARIGLIFSVANVGVIIGALAGNRIARKVGIGNAMVGLCFLGGLAWLLVPLARGSTAVPFLIVAELVFGFCAVCANIIGISLFQAITPGSLLGRMNASRRFVVWGVIPIGGLLGGALGSSIGLRATLWIGAIGAFASFAPLAFSPLRAIASTEDADRIAAPVNVRLAGS